MGFREKNSLAAYSNPVTYHFIKEFEAIDWNNIKESWMIIESYRSVNLFVEVNELLCLLNTLQCLVNSRWSIGFNLSNKRPQILH